MQVHSWRTCEQSAHPILCYYWRALFQIKSVSIRLPALCHARHVPNPRPPIRLTLNPLLTATREAETSLAPFRVAVQSVVKEVALHCQFGNSGKFKNLLTVHWE